MKLIKLDGWCTFATAAGMLRRLRGRRDVLLEAGCDGAAVLLDYKISSCWLWPDAAGTKVRWISQFVTDCPTSRWSDVSVEQALAEQPDNATLHFNYATMLHVCGKLDRAEQHINQALTLAPDDGEGWYLLSGLRKKRPDANHLEAIQQQLTSTDLNPKDEVHLCYALAKELEDLQRYPESFKALQQGASLRRQHINHQVEQDLAVMRCIAETFNSQLFADVTAGYSTSEPIFIVGLPRAGSTLLERLLGCAPDVQLAGELNNFVQSLQQAVRQQHPGQKLTDKLMMVRQSTNLNWRQLGQAYLDSTQPLTAQCQYFVDKLPLNFLYIGLIALALPNAKIIHISREPMDHAYTIYKHLFAHAYPFSYDLTGLGRYMQGYQQLIHH